MSIPNTTATEVVFATMEEGGGGEGQASSLGAIMLIFQGIRRFFRYLRYGNIYSNPDNFLQLFSGHLLNFTFGDRHYVQVAAQCVLIASRILATIDQQKKVYRCFAKLSNHVHGRFPQCDLKAWRQSPQDITIELCPSLQNRIIKGWQRASSYMWQLFYRIYRLVVEIFKLCLALCDAVDSFTLSPVTRNEAINHLFLNAVQQLNYLVENAELLQKLQAERGLIDKVFSKMGSSYNTGQLLTALDPMVRTTAAASQCVESVRSAANGAFLQFAKEGLFGFMAVIGLSDLLPGSWIPPLLLPLGASGSAAYARYPHATLLTTQQKALEGHEAPSIRLRSVAEVYQETTQLQYRLG